MAHSALFVLGFLSCHCCYLHLVVQRELPLFCSAARAVGTMVGTAAKMLAI